MARNTHVTVGPDSYTELTNAAAASATVQALTENVWIAALSAPGTPPDDNGGAILLMAGVPIINEAFADLFPGVSGAARLYARSCGTATKVMISHA